MISGTLCTLWAFYGLKYHLSTVNRRMPRRYTAGLPWEWESPYPWDGNGNDFFPRGDSHRIPMEILTGFQWGWGSPQDSCVDSHRILWEWELKCHSHGNPGTQCPRYRGCLPAILYGTEAIQVRSHFYS